MRKLLCIFVFLYVSMSDEMIIQAIAEYPYLVDIYLYGESVGDGVARARTYFSALDELLSRESASDALSDYGINVAYTYCAAYQTELEDADTHDMFVAQALLDILNEVDDEIHISYVTQDCSPLSTLSTITIHGAQVTVTINSEWHTTEQHATVDKEAVETYGGQIKYDQKNSFISDSTIVNGMCEPECGYWQSKWGKRCRRRNGFRFSFSLR